MFSKISSMFSHVAECVELLVSCSNYEVDHLVSQVATEGVGGAAAAAVGVVAKVIAAPVAVASGVAFGVGASVQEVTGSVVVGRIATGVVLGGAGAAAATGLVALASVSLVGAVAAALTLPLSAWAIFRGAKRRVSDMLGNMLGGSQSEGKSAEELTAAIMADFNAKMNEIVAQTAAERAEEVAVAA